MPRPTWDQVLKAAGYPTTVLLIDFETYFDKGYSLSGTGGLSTIEFVMDPRFEVLGMGLQVADPLMRAVPHASWISAENVREAFEVRTADDLDSGLKNYTVLAHNARFDFSVLSRRFGITPRYSVDLLGLARAWNARARNDLASLAKRLGLPDKGHTEDFKGLSWLKGNITPEKAQALANYCRHDVELEWAAFEYLLPRLSRPEVELRVMTQTLDLYLKPTLRVDAERGAALVVKMESEVEKACVPTGMTRKEISGNTPFKAAMIEALETVFDDPADFLKRTKDGKEILAIAKADPQRKELMEHSSERVRTLMTARNAIKSWPLHIARVNRIMRQAACVGGWLPVPLAYHGAHTGRDSGGERINLQNLGNALGHPLIAEMRQLIVAPPGHKLVIVDASQIEARKTAWAAGQTDLVEKFRSNEEIYCGFASRVLGWPVRKAKKTGIRAIEEHHLWARNSIGKVGVLGCGYGMGKKKAVVYAKGKITEEQAAKIVETYRAENAHIVQFWKDLEKAFRYTAKYRRPCELPRGFRFSSTPDCDVIITLPSGREIHYHDVRFYYEQEFDRHSIEVLDPTKKVWVRTWGGALCENVIQAISRDVLMEAALALEDMGLHTALRVHDELVLVVPEATATEALQVAIGALSASPAWAPDSPLAAEGVVTDRYGAH